MIAKLLILLFFLGILALVIGLLCLPFYLLGARRSGSTLETRSVKDEVVQAQREFDWFWRKRR